MIHPVTACAMVAIVASTSPAQLTLFEQSPASGSAAISVSTGGNDFGFADRRRADNFSLSSASVIDRITFWGGPETSSANPPLANLSGFDIEIYDGSTGAPGALLADITVVLEDTNPTPTGMGIGFLGASMFEFSANLTLAQTVALGSGEYFISIAGNVINPVGIVDEAFQWAGSPAGDGVFFSDSFDGPGYQPLPGASVTNLAFRLSGVPTPGSAALISVGIAGAARRRRSL